MLHGEPAMPDGREPTASLFLTLAGAVSATLERSWQLLFHPGLFVQWLLARRRPGFVVACAIASALAASAVGLPRLLAAPKLDSLATSWGELLLLLGLIDAFLFGFIWFLAPWVLELALWFVDAPEASRSKTRAVSLAIDLVRSVPMLALLAFGLAHCPTPREFVDRFGPLLGLVSALAGPFTVLSAYGCVREAFGGRPRRHRIVLLGIPLSLVLVATVVEISEFLGL